MSDNTTNLNLFKYNLSTDLENAFDIKAALNDNWDKIDGGVALKSHSHSNYALTSHTHSGMITASQSLSSNGYVKFSNGVLLQWGKISNTSGATTAFSFSTDSLLSYSSDSSYSVVTTCYHTTNSNTYERYIQSISKTGFTIHTYSDSSAPVYWLTIGY